MPAAAPLLVRLLALIVTLSPITVPVLKLSLVVARVLPSMRPALAMLPLATIEVLLALRVPLLRLSRLLALTVRSLTASISPELLTAPSTQRQITVGLHRGAGIVRKVAAEAGVDVAPGKHGAGAAENIGHEFEVAGGFDPATAVGNRRCGEAEESLPATSAPDAFSMAPPRISTSPLPPIRPLALVMRVLPSTVVVPVPVLAIRPAVIDCLGLDRGGRLRLRCGHRCCRAWRRWQPCRCGARAERCPMRWWLPVVATVGLPTDLTSPPALSELAAAW